MATASGRFLPRNPQKYLGDPEKIMFRSSWEITAMKYFDSNPLILKWGSEEIAIPYLKPCFDEKTGKPYIRPAKYYPDFLILYEKNGIQIKELIEIKPLKEASPAKAKNAYDKMALAINVAKWKAAEEFCKKHGLHFRVITEKSLFIQKKKR